MQIWINKTSSRLLYHWKSTAHYIHNNGVIHCLLVTMVIPREVYLLMLSSANIVMYYIPPTPYASTISPGYFGHLQLTITFPRQLEMLGAIREPPTNKERKNQWNSTQKFSNTKKLSKFPYMRRATLITREQKMFSLQ